MYIFKDDFNTLCELNLMSKKSVRQSNPWIMAYTKQWGSIRDVVSSLINLQEGKWWREGGPYN